MEYKSNGLVQLTFNPFTKETNYQLFKEQLHNQCLRMKEIGSAINTLTLPVIPPRAALAANAGPDQEFIWKKGEERRLNRTYAQEDSLREIYSLIMGNVDRHVSNSIQMHADFTAATATLNGFLLWRIVSSIASGSTTTESTLMKERRLIDNFTSCSQGDNEPIAEYFFRFSNAIKDITLQDFQPQPKQCRP
jgi:hypothetical protein